MAGAISDRAGSVGGACGSRRQGIQPPADSSRASHDESPIALYTALDGSQPVGWLKSIVVDDCTWVSNVYVQAGYRRRGIGKSLLAKMLRDDRKHGSQASILLASHTGALLYESMGYERLGTLLLFTPSRSY